MPQLEIKNLRVAIGENEIIRDLSLSVGLGEMHAAYDGKTHPAFTGRR